MKIDETISANWRTYRKVLSPNAGPNQIVETRRAFYAGAAMMFAMMNSISDDRPEAESLAAMDGIWQEIQGFKTLIDERKA